MRKGKRDREGEREREREEYECNKTVGYMPQ